MAERDLPLSVFHFDCFWMREFHWGDFVWDPATFPDPEGMLRRLHERGLQVCVWINPYIAQRSRAVRGGRGRPATWSRSAGRLGLAVGPVAGRAWRWSTSPTRRRAPGTPASCETLLDMGVDCFKTDFGERIPTDVVWHDGVRPAADAQLLHAPLQPDRLRAAGGGARRGRGGAVRPLGDRRRPAVPGALGRRLRVHLRVDGRDAARRAVAGRLRASATGATTSAVSRAPRTRRCSSAGSPFGLLSSHSRLHGSGSYRVPWAFDDEAVDVLRRFTRLKLRLMPYLAAAAEEAHRDGVPVLRPMVAGVPRRPGHRAPGPAVHARRRTCSSRRCSAPTGRSPTTCRPAPGRTC